MRYILTLLLLAGAAGIHAQLRYAPNPDRPALRQAAAARAATLMQWTNGAAPHASRGPQDCPPEFFDRYFLFPGDSLKIEIDTFGLGGGHPDDTFSVGACHTTLHYGTARQDSITLTYTAQPDVTAGIDTLCLLFCPQGNDCIELRFLFVVRRPGQRIVADELLVQPQTYNPYCLDDELNLPGTLACSRILDCGDAYDGEGFQNVYFTTYDAPDPCLVYVASRFPGTDTVCVVLCDAFTICDTFAIPFTIESSPLSLPFFDDFSYDGPYPDAQLWLEDQVFINKTLAQNPPSVGIATFDGLDAGGRPYELISGPGDHLTSNHIDLSGLSPADDLWLKCFVAPKGRGLGPSQQDSLLLEFRTADGSWQPVYTWPGFDEVLPTDSVPPFSFYAFPLDKPEFFHDRFQFRFTGFTSPGGISDLWHLDYVWLDRNETPEPLFDDVAFTSPPLTPLAPYTALPWHQLQGHEVELLVPKAGAGLYNHTDVTLSLDDSRVSYRETTTHTYYNQDFTLADGQNANIPPQTHVWRDKDIPAGIFGNIVDITANIPDGDRRQLEVTYWLALDAQGDRFRQNDTLRIRVPFENYFAYDDGSAEWYIYLQNAQNDNPEVAVRFTAFQPDTLRAIQIHFPHANGDVRTQLFNLKVWIGSLDTEPVYEAQLLRPFYADEKTDTLQGFTTYRLEDLAGNPTPVALPQGDFFVGWQQVSVVEFGIPVGFDLDHQPDSVNFVNLGGGWEAFPDELQGAVMIRPVVGSTTPPNTIAGTAGTLPLDAKVRLYPNPAGQALFLEPQLPVVSSWSLRLLDLSGQVLWEGPFQRTLDLSAWPAGVYLIELTDPHTGQRYIERIVRMH